MMKEILRSLFPSGLRIGRSFSAVLLVGVALSTGAAASTAAGRTLVCRSITGVFTATRDPSCQLIRSPARHTAFADMELLAEQGASNVCSTALVEGFWGQRAVVGESLIAQATDPFPDIGSTQNLAIGADAIKIRDQLTKRVLGEIFVRHYVHYDVAANFFSEELVMVAGTGVFRGGKATIRLHGDLFTGADMSGAVCTGM